MPFTVKKLTPIKTDSLINLGQSVLDLAKYVEDEFGFVATALQSTEPDHIWNTAPPRPRRGTYAYADGTHWNPGWGEGPYYYNGSLWLPMNSFASTTVKNIKIQQFTTVGTSTYTPSAGLLFALMTVQAGGGAGGGCNNGSASGGYAGCGGNSGGYSKHLATAAAVGVSQTVTVGAGGTPGAAGANPGGNGGNSSIGALCTANGGSGGPGISSAAFSAPSAPAAAGTGNIIAVPGNVGGSGYYTSTYSGSPYALTLGHGANSLFGAGGLPVWNAGNGNAGTGYGSGGSGGGWVTTVNTASGGAGRQGIALVLEFCNQ
jgi:hypothetical protein